MTFLHLCSLFQWPGYVLAVLGAWGCALKTQRGRFIGFVLSIIADVLWGFFGYSVGSSAMICCQTTYALIVLVGLWNNRPSLWPSKAPR